MTFGAGSSKIAAIAMGALNNCPRYLIDAVYSITHFGSFLIINNLVITL